MKQYLMLKVEEITKFKCVNSFVENVIEIRLIKIKFWH